MPISIDSLFSCSGVCVHWTRMLENYLNWSFTGRRYVKKNSLKKMDLTSGQMGAHTVALPSNLFIIEMQYGIVACNFLVEFYSCAWQTHSCALWTLQIIDTPLHLHTCSILSLINSNNQANTFAPALAHVSHLIGDLLISFK